MGQFSFPDTVEIHPSAKSFIRDCLVLDPTRRMNLQEMLQHDFLCGAPLPIQMPVSTLVCPLQDNFAFTYMLPEI